MKPTETNEPSTEERDLLARSNKIIKPNGGDANYEVGPALWKETGAIDSPTRRKVTFKDMLLNKPCEDDVMAQAWCADSTDSLSDDDSVCEEEEEERECPSIGLSMEDKVRLRKPWLNCLIIKVLGKRVAFAYLDRRLRQLWKITNAEDVKFIDVGNEFYIVRFKEKVDYDTVYYGGSWLVSDHYVTVQRWYPNFDP